MLTLLINETKPLAGLFASTTGGIGSVPDISMADEGQAVSVQTFTRTAGVITDSFVAGDVLHIGIGDGVNAPVCYIELSSASPATGTMAINTVGMVALFAATSANQLTLNVGVVRTRGAYTNTIFSAPIVIYRSVIDPDTAVPTPSILGTGVAAALLVAINTALGFVRLDSSARLPAVDGSQLTNVPNELPSQTGNSGKYLTTNGTATSWGTVSSVSDGDKGDITVSSSGATWTIDNDTITLAKLAHMPTARVLGRTTAGTGTPELLTISGTGSVAMTTSPSFTTPALDTPSAIVLTNASGTAASLTAGNATLAATVTVANEATDTTCFPLFATAATGSLAAMSNAGLTFNSATRLLSATGLAGAFNGTVGATTPSTVAGTTGTFSGTLTVNNNTYANNSVVVTNPSIATIGFDISPYNSTAQVTAGHPWIRIGGGASDSPVINAGAAGGYVDICTDLGSGLRVRDGTGGHLTYLTAPATGTLRVTTNGSTLGTVDAATFTGNAATVTTIPALSGAITNTGNATVLGSFTMAQLSTAVSDGDPAYVGAANTFTAANAFSLAPGASTSAISTTGAIYAAGTGTTNFPHIYINESGATASTSWSTTGTALGINLNTASPKFIDCKVDGTSGGGIPVSYFEVDGSGNTNCFGAIYVRANSAKSSFQFAIGTSNGNMLSGFVWQWAASSGEASGTKDLTFSRQSAGILQIGTSAANALGSLGCLNIVAGGTLAVTGASTLTGLLTANGGITLGDAQNIAFNTTTGTKIGATTSQKLSFWNATPIVQPTTAVASATVASPGGGTNLKTDDTFDGYTIAQVVKALRNAGLLA